jgi:hypothetical protein
VYQLRLATHFARVLVRKDTDGCRVPQVRVCRPFYETDLRDGT